MKLYEINEAIEQLVDPETGEITDLEALDRLQMERDEKIENVGRWYKNLTSDARQLREEAGRLDKRAEVMERTAARIRSWLAIALGGRPFESADKTLLIKMKKNGGMAPLIFDEAVAPWQVPEEFQTVTVDFNSKAIRRALDAGEPVQFAHYGERGSHLEIK